MSDQWRYIGALIFLKGGPRADRTFPLVIPAASAFVRVEVFPLVLPAQWPDWYRAGWLNQVAQFGARQLILPSQVVPMIGPAALPMNTDRPYKIRFEPVGWLPPCRVTFYYLL